MRETHTRINYLNHRARSAQILWKSRFVLSRLICASHPGNLVHRNGGNGVFREIFEKRAHGVSRDDEREDDAANLGPHAVGSGPKRCLTFDNMDDLDTDAASDCSSLEAVPSTHLTLPTAIPV